LGGGPNIAWFANVFLLLGLISLFHHRHRNAHGKQRILARTAVK